MEPYIAEKCIILHGFVSLRYEVGGAERERESEIWIPQYTTPSSYTVLSPFPFSEVVVGTEVGGEGREGGGVQSEKLSLLVSRVMVVMVVVVCDRPCGTDA